MSVSPVDIPVHIAVRSGTMIGSTGSASDFTSLHLSMPLSQNEKPKSDDDPEAPDPVV